MRALALKSVNIKASTLINIHEFSMLVRTTPFFFTDTGNRM